MVGVPPYGYATEVFPSRGIAGRSEGDLAFRVLGTGNLPSRRTLCGFRRRHLEDLQGPLVEVVRVARGTRRASGSFRRAGRGAGGKQVGPAFPGAIPVRPRWQWIPLWRSERYENHPAGIGVPMVPPHQTRARPALRRVGAPRERPPTYRGPERKSDHPYRVRAAVGGMGRPDVSPFRPSRPRRRRCSAPSG